MSKVSTFGMDKNVKKATGNDTSKRFLTFENASDNRSQLIPDGKLANMVFNAVYPDSSYLKAAIVSTFVGMPDDMVSSIVENVHGTLDVFDYVREANTDGAKLLDVNRKPYSYNDAFSVRTIGEWYATNAKGGQTLRGYRVEVTDGKEVYDLDIATNRQGHVAAKTYGIGALFKLVQKAIAAYAAKEAMDMRKECNAFIDVEYELVKLASGTAVDHTAKK